MTTRIARTLRIGLFAMLVGIGLLGLLGGMVATPAAAQSAPGQTIVVTARGIVNPTLAHYLSRTIDRAEQDGAGLVVIELDTPGGLDVSMRQIIQRILSSKTPVAVYVSPQGARAGSAGVYITYAAHLAAMAPNTNIGSATPVSMSESGEQQMSPEMRAKVTNDAIAYIRALAEERGRNADWAEKAVREGANVSAQEAARTQVVDLVAADLPDLLRQIDGRTVNTAAGPLALRTADAAVQRVEMGWVDAFLHAIGDPTIAYLLLSLGTMGLFFELSNPGSILPGVAGGICLVLAFYSLGSLPVSYAGLLLMLFAFLLFVADIFAPTHGVLTVGGLVAFVLGSFMLFNVPEAAPWLSVSAWTIVSVAAVMGAFFLYLARLVAKAHRLKPATGSEGLVGQTGRARTALDPNGMVFVESALWEATSVGGPIAAGAAVQVVEMDGLHLRVRPAPATVTSSVGPQT